MWNCLLRWCFPDNYNIVNGDISRSLMLITHHSLTKQPVLVDWNLYNHSIELFFRKMGFSCPALSIIHDLVLPDLLLEVVWKVNIMVISLFSLRAVCDKHFRCSYWKCLKLFFNFLAFCLVLCDSVASFYEVCRWIVLNKSYWLHTREAVINHWSERFYTASSLIISERVCRHPLHPYERLDLRKLFTDITQEI